MNRLLIAYGTPAQPLDAGETLPANGFIWLDAVYDELDTLAAEVQRLTGNALFEDHVLDARNAGHPSFFDSTDHYEMIVFRGLVTETEPAGIQTEPLFMFRFERLLATHRSPRNRACAGVRDRLKGNASHLPRSPDELAHRLLSSMVDRYLDLRQSITSRSEKWQKALLDPRRSFKDWYGLLEFRNELRQLESVSEGQLDAVQEWRDERFEDVSAELQVRLADLVEHVTRVIAHARRIDAQIDSAIQLHYSSVTHRTSEIMRTLTLITAIFMPLTLITGIFGMNFELIPGLHSKFGFWYSLGGMAIVVMLMMGYFRFRRWI